MVSLFKKAETNIINEDSGRWKFVIIASTILNSNPGEIKISGSVHPLTKTINKIEEIFQRIGFSIVYVTVVPTAIILPDFR